MRDTDLKKLTDHAMLKASKIGATYADIRVNKKYQQNLSMENGFMNHTQSETSMGLGVRVLCDGAWGFASSSITTVDEIERITAKAVDIAKASAKMNTTPVVFPPRPPQTADLKSTFIIDPRSILMDKKIAFLKEANKVMDIPKIDSRYAYLDLEYHDTVFANSEGSFIHQQLISSGYGGFVSASDNRGVANRWLPDNSKLSGWENIESGDFASNYRLIAEQCVNLLKAKPCPKGRKDIVLGTGQMEVQIHESIGHALELDRVLGAEANFAGKSFVKPDMIGKLKYGSDIINVSVDPTTQGALGTYWFDDEGTETRKTYLIKNGILTGFLNSRETAAQLGMEPIGTARAQSWNRLPIVRMSCVNLEPGNLTLDELIDDIDDGIYMDFNRSWSIDDRRVNFQFSTEIGWEIKNGNLGEMIRTPSYTGSTIEFWNSCDGIGDSSQFKVHVTGCGKGEPVQGIELSHGSCPTRFRNIEVGVA